MVGSGVYGTSICFRSQSKLGDSSDTNMRNEQQEVEDEEGPPPGWYSIPPQQHKMESEHQDIKEGAPPGWHTIPPPQLKIEQNQDTEEEGPPPGWNLMPPPQPKTNENQDIGKGSPPGWQSMNPQQKIGSEKQDIGEEGPPPGLDSVPQTQPKMGSEQQGIKEVGSQPGWNSKPPPQPQLPSPIPTTTLTASTIPTLSGGPFGESFLLGIYLPLLFLTYLTSICFHSWSLSYKNMRTHAHTHIYSIFLLFFCNTLLLSFNFSLSLQTCYYCLSILLEIFQK